MRPWAARGKFAPKRNEAGSFSLRALQGTAIDAMPLRGVFSFFSVTYEKSPGSVPSRGIGPCVLAHTLEAESRTVCQLRRACGISNCMKNEKWKLQVRGNEADFDMFSSREST